MSDDLVKRLRSGLSDFDDWDAAADRIEELEDKLAKAAEALDRALGWIDWHRHNPRLINHNSYLFETKARYILAELKGQDDE